MAKKPFDISEFAASLQPVVSDSDTQMMEISLDHITPNPGNFYPLLEDGEMLELENSIRANGLLEPLTVVPGEDPGYYRLISGHNRFAALLNLRQSAIYRGDVPHKWDKVLCMILPVMTESQEVSAIIEANRQRKKDGWLLAVEAQKLTDSYVARKQAGEELPGRIRERVAAALQVSQTKLATVASIKKHLVVPGFKSRWEKGDLPEDAAYEISKLDENSQYRYLDWVIDRNKAVTAKTVKEFYREKTQPPKPAPAPMTSAPANPMERSPEPFAQGHENGPLVWHPLDADHWPEHDSIALLRGETRLGGRVYVAVRCVGNCESPLPFEDALDHVSLHPVDMEDLTEWALLEGGAQHD